MILTSTHCKKLMMNSMGCYSSWSLPWICCCGRCLNVHVDCHCSYCLVDFLLLSELQLLSNYSISFTFFWFFLLFGKEFLSSGFLSLFSLFHVWVFLFPSDGTATQSSKVLWCILNCPFLGSIVGLFVRVFPFRNCGARMSMMMKETQHACQGWCQRYPDNRPETFILH